MTPEQKEELRIDMIHWIDTYTESESDLEASFLYIVQRLEAKEEELQAIKEKLTVSEDALKIVSYMTMRPSK